MPMIKYLDPRFHLIAALIDDPDETQEMREIARQQAEEIALQCGYSFDEAMGIAGLALPSVPIEEPTPACVQTIDALDTCDRSETADGGEPPLDEQEDHVSTEPGPVSHEGFDDPVVAALQADPGRSDRDIAREFGRSPSTVAKRRGLLGLDRMMRSVTRRGKAYDMAVGDRS